MNLFRIRWARALILILITLSVTLSVSLSIQNVFAEDRKNPSRKKVIDFEGDLVEGVNKRPLDSLSEISEQQRKRRKTHLYRKRKGFSTESEKMISELRYLE